MLFVRIDQVNGLRFIRLVSQAVTSRLESASRTSGLELEQLSEGPAV